MNVTFLKAKIPLVKEITQDGTKPYPLVKNFTSKTYDIPKTHKGMKEFYDTLQKAASQGMCLHKGPLKQELKNESRAFAADRLAPSDYLVIDIDGLELPYKKITSLKNLAEKVITQLPEYFQDVSYIAQASASLGFKPNKISLHLFFFLKQAMNPKTLKEWMKMLNYETDLLSNQLKLSANGQSLSYILDPSVADNSKLIYLAPPKFVGVEDPIAGERFVYVKNSNATLDLSSYIHNPERVHNLGIQIKDNLRKKQNLPKKTGKVTNITVQGQPQDVLQNPDKMTIEICRVAEPYVNCNVNGGDSGAYYFILESPHYMYNFKGEPIWEIQKADPDFYKSIFEIFADKINANQKLKPIVLRDFHTDTYYNGIFNEATQQFSDEYPLTPTNKNSLEDFMRTHNRTVPDFIPDARVVFDPSTEKGIELEEAPYFVNLYRRTPYMLQAKETQVLEYGTANTLQKLTPNIYKLIKHVLGNGVTEFEHFINWLAYIYQNKRKTMTAWIFTGVPGTGKGLLVHKVLKPLFGEGQVPMRSLENIEEQFNLYMRTALFLVVDEFRMNDSGNVGRMADKLKHQVTEPTLTIRAMRTNQVELPSFCNFIFLTNRGDAVKIEDGDRRYNVGPRQEDKLENVHPTLLQNIEALDTELFTFAGVLQTFQVDNKMAHTTLENEAKSQMKEISMSVLEEFAFAIRQKNLEYFIDILEIPLTNTFDAGPVSTAQRYLKDWIAKVGQEICLPMSQLKLMYDILTDSRNKLSQRDFTKAMSRLNIATSVKRVKDKTLRGVVLTWKLNNNVRESLIKEHFEDNDLKLLKA
jgi:hypothetical protein